MFNVHEDEMQIKCNIYDSSFKTLYYNIASNSWIQERSIFLKCTICISFVQKFSLYIDITSVHEGKRPFDFKKKFFEQI